MVLYLWKGDNMVNKIFLLGIIIFGINIIGCDGNSDENSIDTDLNGTWLFLDDVDVSIDNWKNYLKLNNGNYEIFSTTNEIRNSGGGKGTYKTENGLFTMVTTHYYVEIEYSQFEEYDIEKNKWYTKNELINSIGLTNSEFENKYGYIFKPVIYNYGVNKYNLIFTLVDYPEGIPYQLREVIYLIRIL
jgi:hypothetical protein